MSSVVQKSVPDSGSRLQSVLTGTAPYALELTPLQIERAAKGAKSAVTQTKETNPAKRLPLIQQGQRKLNADLPVIPIAWTGKYRAHAKFIRITGASTGTQLLGWHRLEKG